MEQTSDALLQECRLLNEGDFMNEKRVGKMTFKDTGTLIRRFIDDQADGHGIYEDY